MTPKESLLKELETADEALIAETLSWVRSRKQNLTQALEATRALPTDYQGFIDVMANLRRAIESEDIEFNPDEIWGDVRDRTPAPKQLC